MGSFLLRACPKYCVGHASIKIVPIVLSEIQIELGILYIYLPNLANLPQADLKVSLTWLLQEPSYVLQTIKRKQDLWWVAIILFFPLFHTNKSVFLSRSRMEGKNKTLCECSSPPSCWILLCYDQLYFWWTCKWTWRVEVEGYGKIFTVEIVPDFKAWDLGVDEDPPQLGLWFFTMHLPLCIYLLQCIMNLIYLIGSSFILNEVIYEKSHHK